MTQRGPVSAGTGVEAQPRLGGLVGAGALSALLFGSAGFAPALAPLSFISPLPLVVQRLRGGMAGAWLGASLARWVPGAVQLALFAAVMLVAAFRMLRSAPLAAGKSAPHPFAVVAGGTAVGALSGLVGVGGGFLIVPALVLLAGVPMTSAIGTSLAVIAMNSFTGFGKYLHVLEAKGHTLEWRTLLVIALIGIVGSVAGSRLGRRLPQAKLRTLFGVFLVVMGLFVAADAAPRLLQ